MLTLTIAPVLLAPKELPEYPFCLDLPRARRVGEHAACPSGEKEPSQGPFVLVFCPKGSCKESQGCEPRHHSDENLPNLLGHF